LQSNQNDLTKIIKSDQSNLIKQTLINCIGCRTSIEKFYQHLMKSLNKNSSISKYSLAIDPFKIDSSGYLTLKDEILNNEENSYLLYSFFYINSSKYDNLIDQIVKFKKTSKRCNLHSFEYMTNQKSISSSSLTVFHNSITNRRSMSPLSSSTSSSSTSSLDQIANIDTSNSSFTSALIKSDWLNVWHSFSNDELRLKTLVIDTSKFLLTLESYLRKHKFCNECKLKVIKAYNLLVGETDSSKEKNFCPELYDGITYCSSSDGCFYTNLNDLNGSANNNCESSISLKNGSNDCKIKSSKSLSSKLKNSKNKHLHIKNDKKYVSFLIAKAEPDLLGR
jgi:hypothetical protein